MNSICQIKMRILIFAIKNVRICSEVNYGCLKITHTLLKGAVSSLNTYTILFLGYLMVTAVHYLLHLLIKFRLCCSVTV